MNRRGIADLIPWYLNGTLGARERQRVEGHLQECSTCRDELARERRIYEAMTVEPSVEYMPAPSLKRLQAAISGRGAEHPASPPAVVRRLLSGGTGPIRDIVLLNAAAAITAAGGLSGITSSDALAKALGDGLARAAAAVDSGAGTDLLDRWTRASNRLATPRPRS